MPVAEQWTVRRLLEWTTPFFTRKDVDAPRLSAELLLAHVLSVPRLKLYTDYDRPLSDDDLATYKSLVRRAAEHEPIAYLTNRAFFFGLEFEVTRDVLIPRPDTETIVENVLQLNRHQPGMEAPRILDLCTGSGCLAVALAHHLKSANVLAIDISPTAVDVARRNVQRHNLADRVVVEQGDLFDGLKNVVDPQPFDLIVSNPPYVPSPAIRDLDRNVRDYEPRLALDGGVDGLSIIRRILSRATDHLKPAGRLYIEMQFDQAESLLALAAEQKHLDDVKILKDQSARDRVLTARRIPRP
jgi:release factor glutamine methyltransferase